MMKQERPVCVHCGEAYGRRNTARQTLVWPKGEAVPDHTCPGTIVRRDWLHIAPHGVRGSYGGHSYTENDNVMIVDIWNGTWLSGTSDPFCTLRCALDYAQQAYECLGPASQLTGRRLRR